MAIYTKSVRALMREDMRAALAASPDSIFSRQQAINWFAKNYPKIKTGTVTAHLTCLTTNAHSRIHHLAKPGEDDLFFQIDRSHYRLYRAGVDPSPVYPRRESARKPAVPDPVAVRASTRVTVDELGQWRRCLMQLLKRLYKIDTSERGVGSWIKSLSSERRVPRQIASCMSFVVEVRNAAEYDSVQLSDSLSNATVNAWNAILEWASGQKITLHAECYPRRAK